MSITQTIQSKSEEIILASSGKASAVSALPVPVIDILAVCFIQVRMIDQLAKLFNAKSDHKSVVVLTTFLSSLTGRLVSEILATLADSTGVSKVFSESLIKAAVTGFTTSVVGEAYQYHFQKGGNMEDMSIQTVANYMSDQIKGDRLNLETIGSKLLNKAMDQIA